MNIANDDLSSKYPTFSAELIEKCTQSRDFRPILFEWYKFVGLLCNKVSCISLDSPAIRKISPVHYAVLIGLLNRCSRLMLSTIRLSSTRKYGETTQLLSRSIAETAVKTQWLCRKHNHDSIARYLADGLKKDLILKKQVEKNIENRDGSVLVIEQRMLDSIQNCISLSGLSEHDIDNAKRFPDFAQICKDLEYNDTFYTAIQRMGSHAVHGTWSDLVFNYLINDDGQRFYPRDHEIETRDAQYIVSIHLVLAAMEQFLRYVVSDVSEINEIISKINEIDEKITEIQHLAWDADFSNYS
ncbi:MAG: hypothetical protein IBX69_12430 [Anaerolineales bacterium]|nr:hypothetical protein [Anaerolineales bacterium]